MVIRNATATSGGGNDVIIAVCLLVVGLFILKSPAGRRLDDGAAPEAGTTRPVMAFRGVSIRERAVEAPAEDATPPPAAAPQADATKAESAPKAAPASDDPAPSLADPGGSSRSGTVIELVYKDATALMREAAQYGFVVARLGEPAPSRSVGSIDCPGFRLYFDRALYRRIDREIGPLSGLPGGALLSVALDGGRLRRLS